MQNLVDKAILASRHILVVFFLGLAVALVLYAARFVWKVAKFGLSLGKADDTELLLGLLYLLDSALVATLTVTVLIASHDGLVSRLSEEPGARRVGWVAEGADPGNLKIKLATAIIAISSIHLLQIFLKVPDYGDREISWAMAIHGMFLLGGISLAVMDKLEGTTKALKKAAAAKKAPGGPAEA